MRPALHSWHALPAKRRIAYKTVQTYVTVATMMRRLEETKLTELDLWGTKITDAGVQHLKQSLPNLTIVRDQGK